MVTIATGPGLGSSPPPPSLLEEGTKQAGGLGSAEAAGSPTYLVRLPGDGVELS